MECPQCATANPKAANFRLNCGARLVLVCPQCGTGLHGQARFCTACGAPVSVPLPRPAPASAAQPAIPEIVADRLRRLVPQEYADRLLATRGQVSPERRTLDQAERMELYGRAQAFLAEEVPILPLWYSRYYLLVKPWVKRYPVSALGRVFWKDVVLEPHLGAGGGRPTLAPVRAAGRCAWPGWLCCDTADVD